MLNISKTPSSSSPSQQTSSATPGIKIGAYDILGSIGQGNFSVCKLARSRLTNQFVAIKCVVKKNLDTTHLSRIYREIEIMKSIDHPNIIKLNQVMESKSMLYLVCEYASNGEIFEYIQKYGAMSEKMACEKFCQVVSAIEYCHAKNIVHRDLKTENLLFDAKMNVKLVDFGFANHYDLINPLKTFCGSPPYAAPELFCGKKYYGPEVDIWSLGVILYVLVTGTLPFESENLQHLKQKILSCKYRVPYSMSHDCENLISHILVINQSKRFKLQQIRMHKWIKANTPSFYYMSFNSNDNSNNESNNSSYENESIEDANYTKNNEAYFRIKKKSSSFKTKSFKKKFCPPTSNIKNSDEDLDTVESNKQVASNKNLFVNNQKQLTTQENEQNESENFNFNSPDGFKKSSTLSCISLPLFSFEEYNNKEMSQPNEFSTSNTNLNGHSLDNNNDNSLKKTESVYESTITSQKEIPGIKDISSGQISNLIKESQKENAESCSNKFKTCLYETHPHGATSSSQNSQYSFDLNKSFDLKLNLQNETFTHLFSNSSSLDEGVESDLSSMSSSISSDLLSLSRSPNGSILVSSFEAKNGQKLYNQPVRGLLRRMTHKNSFCLSPGRSYKRQRFACFKRGLIKSPRIKNLNDLTEIKNELNFLMEDTNVIKKGNLHTSLKKMNISDIPSNAQRQIILKKIQESFNKTNKINESEDNNKQNKDETQNHSHLFKCILKKSDEDFSSYFHEESLAQRRKHLLKQTSISLNSVNEECPCNVNDPKENGPLSNNFEISNQIHNNTPNDVSNGLNIQQHKVLNTNFKQYHRN